MRIAVLALLCGLAVAGCATASRARTPDGSLSEAIEKPVTHRCDAAPVQYHVGHQATQDMGAAILGESGAKTLRWGPPDSLWTGDYREDRVNVRYDRDMKITAVTCG